ncbi:MAG: hypothetical protein F4120_11215 [Rhodothermaceae bacterium]|nr:hypothetical protein [Rhodothermaceae bacterium]MXW33875.1 hypothetical protein [Rhodothermaceae bacterium]MYC04804.1 hypothetical protein [Rhodothermaceae bacterium]MYI18170.1 hypothetical protein [Rhodothermaceae bacterium]MYJ19761.1 hypothetical protein [Rhodothermaceae bacterium]
MSQRTVKKTAEFTQELKRLSKKHRGLPSEVQTILSELTIDKGRDGDRLSRLSGLPVFKIRCRIGNMGLSKGARIIYYKDNSKLWALYIYRKSDREGIPDKKIIKILKKYGLQP